MKTGNSRKMAALLSTAFMLGATGVTAFASNVTGLSVNTEFPPPDMQERDNSREFGLF